MKSALRETTIIPFFPIYRREGNKAKDIEPLAIAAWEFARCALWPEHQFTDKHVESAMRYIREYFKAATGKKRAFTALCQRVILTQKYVSKSSERFVPMPVVWFNRRYPFGFAGTLPWLYSVEQRRREVPGYLAHIEALADDYYIYAMKPTKKALGRFLDKLQCLNAPSLLQLFGEITPYSKPHRA